MDAIKECAWCNVGFPVRDLNVAQHCHRGGSTITYTCRSNSACIAPDVRKKRGADRRRENSDRRRKRRRARMTPHRERVRRLSVAGKLRFGAATFNKKFGKGYSFATLTKNAEQYRDARVHYHAPDDTTFKMQIGNYHWTRNDEDDSDLSSSDEDMKLIPSDFDFDADTSDDSSSSSDGSDRESSEPSSGSDESPSDVNDRESDESPNSFVLHALREPIYISNEPTITTLNAADFDF